MATPADILTRRHGKEIINYFAGSPLNRVAFLREDHQFLSSAFEHPSAAILLLDGELSPWVKDKNGVDYVKAKDISSLFGAGGLKPFAKTEEMAIQGYDSSEPGEVLILFLGLDEGMNQNGAENGEGKENRIFRWKEYSGRPYFAVHVAPAEGPGGVDAETVEKVKKQLEERGGMWLRDVRGASLVGSDAAIYALSRHLLDWNLRNPFCATCGSRTIPVHAGWKRVCPPIDISPSSVPRPPCSSRGHISNVTFPRTDPTVIAAVVNAAGTRILLGRQRRWPPLMYSTLAGFVEPGESLEEAVRREVWEESGVRVGRVVLVSSQPWPFPGGLMIGALAVGVDGGEEIHLGHDPELEDARWFGREEVVAALRERERTSGDRNGDRNGEVDGRKDGAKIKLPPKTAIANRLIEMAVGLLDEIGGSKI